MSRNVLLITAQAVKDRTAASDNIDDKIINPCIKTAQDTYIQSLLGSDLYNRLLDGVVDDDLTANEKLLIDTYIVDCLIWYTLSELPLALGYKLMNMNVTKATPEGAQQPTMSEMIDLENEYKKKGAFYEQRLINYLRQSEASNLYPLYTTYGTGYDVIKPNRNTASTNIWLGPEGGDCTDRRPFWKYNQGEGYE